MANQLPIRIILPVSVLLFVIPTVARWRHWLLKGCL